MDSFFGWGDNDTLKLARGRHGFPNLRPVSYRLQGWSQKGSPFKVSLPSNGSVCKTYNYKMESIQVDHLKLSGGSK